MCVLSQLGFNCNILGDDPGHLGLGVPKQDSTYGQAEGKFSCDRRVVVMKKYRLSFSAIERWIYPQEICTDKFLYMTCLRHPVSRIKSSVKFHAKQTEEMVVNWATKHTFQPAAPVSTGSPSVDNFYIRSFAGISTYMKKQGEITTEDLDTAKSILSHFEVVLILEHFDRDLIQLQKILGWRTTALGKAKSTASRKVSFTPAQETILTIVNALDIQLYTHADRVAAKISTSSQQGGR